MSFLVNSLEAVLFVADAPVALADLCEAVGGGSADVEDALVSLGGRLEQTSGLQLVRLAGGYQICTKKECAESVTRFLRPQRRRLGRSALEVLAIVAYKQPVTTSEIEVIRGVQSDYALRVLLDRGLIEEGDRKQAPGRPILYITTQDFLHQFKLNDLSELPSLNGKQLGLEEIG